MKSISLQKLIITFVIGLMTSGINAQNEAPQTLPQFLFPAFAKGIVKMKDGRRLAALLNYNMVDEEMIFEQNNVVSTIVVFGSTRILDLPLLEEKARVLTEALLAAPKDKLLERELQRRTRSP